MWRHRGTTVPLRGESRAVFKLGRNSSSLALLRCILADSCSLSIFSLVLCRKNSSKSYSILILNYEGCIIPEIKKKTWETGSLTKSSYTSWRTTAFLQIFSRTSPAPNLPGYHSWNTKWHFSLRKSLNNYISKSWWNSECLRDLHFHPSSLLIY